MASKVSASIQKTGLHALFFVIAVVLLLIGCDPDHAAKKMSGNTMGTTYHITMINPSSEINLTDLQRDIDIRLTSLNGIFSTYDENSELMRLNHATVNEWITVSHELLDVLDMALSISARSGGAYDVTVGPLVELWGFGKKEVASGTMPDTSALQRAKERVCYQCVEFDAATLRVRKKQEVYIDLSSIAKGYAVDQIADLLYKHQINNYMVEIGGEVVTRGNNLDKQDWTLGIESPHVQLPTDTKEVQQIISVSDRGVATSGDYRNFVIIDGNQYSHIIDPTTGYPVVHSPASVTVIAESCALADGWATALTVLGVERGLEIAKVHGLAAYFISRQSDGALTTSMTDAFKPYLESH